jgi:AraC-like DNA-binding protein
MQPYNIARLIRNISVVDSVSPFRAVCFGDVRYQPGGTCGPREQLDFQLVIIHEGEALISVDEEEQWVGPNQVALLKPGRREFFQFSQLAETHHSWCAVAPSLVESGLAARLKETPPSLRLGSRMASLIELGLKPLPLDSPVRGEWLITLGEACLRAYLLEAESDAVAPLPEALLRARTLIETRFSEPLSLEILAKAASVSPPHLARLFQRYLKITPAKMLWQCRIKSGMQLLADTGLTVAEVAYRTGFQNPFHFSRMLKKETGRSPREFRKECWNPINAEKK